MPDQTSLQTGIVDVSAVSYPDVPDYPEAPDPTPYVPIEGPEARMDGFAASASQPAQYRPAQLVLGETAVEPERAAALARIERYAAMPPAAPVNDVDALAEEGLTTEY
jgi:hypothetical protein